MIIGAQHPWWSCQENNIWDSVKFRQKKILRQVLVCIGAGREKQKSPAQVWVCAHMSRGFSMGTIWFYTSLLHRGWSKVLWTAKGRFTKGGREIFSGGGVLLTFQWYGKTPFLKCVVHLTFFSFYLRKILNIFWISPDHWCWPTLSSEELTAAATVNSWCSLDGLLH